jgi:hypothetical protein
MVTPTAKAIEACGKMLRCHIGGLGSCIRVSVPEYSNLFRPTMSSSWRFMPFSCQSLLYLLNNVM